MTKNNDESARPVVLLHPGDQLQQDELLVGRRGDRGLGRD